MKVTNKNSIAISKQFPALHQFVHNRPLVYLDNANTTQKPQIVIDKLRDYYYQSNSNVHRAVHSLSVQATQQFENARKIVQKFINAKNVNEIVFTKGGTEAINLVAHSWGRSHLKPNDEILISAMEHHANIVPWQMICKATGAILKVIPISLQGEIDLQAFEQLLTSKTKIVGLVHISNTLGTINPIKEMIEKAHAIGAKVLIDGAQAAGHVQIDVQNLDADFYTFSGHKVYGPTGTGVLYGKYSLLESMPPYQGGGDMIQTVSFEKTVYKNPPNRFEAGTPNIAGVIGLGAALEFINELKWENIYNIEHEITEYALDQLDKIEGLRLIGQAKDRIGLFSFVMDGIHPHDIATIVDHDGIAIRAGNHCTMPLMNIMGVSATTRASFCFYNTCEEVDILVQSLQKVKEIFK